MLARGGAKPGQRNGAARKALPLGAGGDDPPGCKKRAAAAGRGGGGGGGGGGGVAAAGRLAKGATGTPRAPPALGKTAAGLGQAAGPKGGKPARSKALAPSPVNTANTSGLSSTTASLGGKGKRARRSAQGTPPAAAAAAAPHGRAARHGWKRNPRLQTPVGGGILDPPGFAPELFTPGAPRALSWTPAVDSQDGGAPEVPASVLDWCGLRCGLTGKFTRRRSGGGSASGGGEEQPCRSAGASASTAGGASSSYQYSTPTPSFSEAPACAAPPRTSRTHRAATAAACFLRGPAGHNSGGAPASRGSSSSSSSSTVPVQAWGSGQGPRRGGSGSGGTGGADAGFSARCASPPPAPAGAAPAAYGTTAAAAAPLLSSEAVGARPSRWELPDESFGWGENLPVVAATPSAAGVSPARTNRSIATTTYHGNVGLGKWNADSTATLLGGSRSLLYERYSERGSVMWVGHAKMAGGRNPFETDGARSPDRNNIDSSATSVSPLSENTQTAEPDEFESNSMPRYTSGSVAPRDMPPADCFSTSPTKDTAAARAPSSERAIDAAGKGGLLALSGGEFRGFSRKTTTIKVVSDRVAGVAAAEMLKNALQARQRGFSMSPSNQSSSPSIGSQGGYSVYRDRVTYPPAAPSPSGPDLQASQSPRADSSRHSGRKSDSCGPQRLAELADHAPDHWYNTYYKIREKGDNDGDMEACSESSSGSTVGGSRRRDRGTSGGDALSPKRQGKPQKRTTQPSLLLQLPRGPAGPGLAAADVHGSPGGGECARDAGRPRRSRGRLRAGSLHVGSPRRRGYVLAADEATERGGIELEQSSGRVRLAAVAAKEAASVGGARMLTDAISSSLPPDLSSPQRRGAVLHGVITTGSVPGLRFFASQFCADGAWLADSLPDGTTPLTCAVRCRHLDVVRELLRQGADPSGVEPDARKWSPLHYAASLCAPEQLSVLLGGLDLRRRRAAVNQKDGDGAAPLHVVLRCGEVGRDVRAFVTLLMSAGADLTSESFGESGAELLLREDTVDLLAAVAHQLADHLKRRVLPHSDRLPPDVQSALQQMVVGAQLTVSSVAKLTVAVPFVKFDAPSFVSNLVGWYNVVSSRNTRITEDKVLVLSVVRCSPLTTNLRVQISGHVHSDSIMKDVVKRLNDTWAGGRGGQRSPSTVRFSTGADAAAADALSGLALLAAQVESQAAPGAGDLVRTPQSAATPRRGKEPAGEAAWSPDSCGSQYSPPRAASKGPAERSLAGLFSGEAGEDPGHRAEEYSTESVAAALLRRFDCNGDGALNLLEWNAMLADLGSAPLRPEDFGGMCMGRRLPPDKGLNAAALAAMMTPVMEENFRELLSVPRMGQRVTVDGLRVRRVLNGATGVVSGYRKEGVVLVDLPGCRSTPVALRNLSWDGQRDWLRAPEGGAPTVSISFEGVSAKQVAEACETRPSRFGNWVRLARQVEGEEGDRRCVSWRVYRACGRRVQTVEELVEAVGKRRLVKLIMTPPPVAASGSAVRIVGLHAPAHRLNGVTGTVVATREHGAVGLVRVRGVALATPVAAINLTPVDVAKKPAAGGDSTQEPPRRSLSVNNHDYTPQPGDHVEVFGLQVHHDLNGRHGVVASTRASDGVAFVDLDDDDFMNAPIRAGNLRLLDYTVSNP
ncbi:hypothetical protein DIPPA_12096 [Diplonema papillatum]|nr:hypothetical protein DIPPA_12096 [Diplonema papillatum]